MTDINTPAPSTSTALSLRLKESTSARAARDAAKQRREQERVKFSEQQTNLIFAVDATGSRSAFWEQTKIVQEQMFFAVHETGSKLSSQLVSYSGEGPNKKLTVSPWCNSPQSLCEEMDKVSCEAGTTQIEEVFKHVIDEACSREIHTVILAVDSCEEAQSDLIPLARQLNSKGIQLFLFDDGVRTTGRANGTDEDFKVITEASGGIYAEFSLAKLEVLEEYLRTVAVMATKNTEAVHRLELTTRTVEGQKLLQQAKALLPEPK